jgi:hypothetical protein
MHFDGVVAMLCLTVFGLPKGIKTSEQTMKVQNERMKLCRPKSSIPKNS